MTWAITQKTGDCESKFLLLMLANYSDPEGVCYPSVRKLSRDTSLSESTVHRRIKWLLDQGLIKIEPRKSIQGDPQSNLYRLSIPEDKECETPPVRLTPPPCQSDTTGGVSVTPNPISTEPVNEPVPPHPPKGGEGVDPNWPLAFQGAPFQPEWKSWMGYRKEKGFPRYTPIGLKRTVSLLAGMGVERAIAALEHSMANNYQGIVEPKNASTVVAGSSNGTKTASAYALKCKIEALEEKMRLIRNRGWEDAWGLHLEDEDREELLKLKGQRDQARDQLAEFPT